MIYLVAILKDASEKENLKVENLSEFTVAQEANRFIDQVTEGVVPATEVSADEEVDEETEKADNEEEEKGDE